MKNTILAVIAALALVATSAWAGRPTYTSPSQGSLVLKTQLCGTTSETLAWPTSVSEPVRVTITNSGPTNYVNICQISTCVATELVANVKLNVGDSLVIEHGASKILTSPWTCLANTGAVTVSMVVEGVSGFQALTP